jgi:hypothetical protein
MLSGDSERSSMSMNRARLASSAAERSSIRGQPSDVCVVMQAGTQQGKLAGLRIGQSSLARAAVGHY